MVNGIEATLCSTFSSDPLSPPSSPLILVISGPSGVGKDAVIKLLCGGIAGCTAALFTTPFNVIKTKLQTQVPGTRGKYMEFSMHYKRLQGKKICKDFTGV